MSTANCKAVFDLKAAKFSKSIAFKNDGAEHAHLMPESYPAVNLAWLGIRVFESQPPIHCSYCETVNPKDVYKAIWSCMPKESV